MKKICVSVVGSGQLHEINIETGTTAGDILRASIFPITSSAEIRARIFSPMPNSCTTRLLKGRSSLPLPRQR